MAWPSDKSSRGTYGKYVVFPGSRATFLRVHHRFVRMTAPPLRHLRLPVDAHFLKMLRARRSIPFHEIFLRMSKRKKLLKVWLLLKNVIFRGISLILISFVITDVDTDCINHLSMWCCWLLRFYVFEFQERTEMMKKGNVQCVEMNIIAQNKDIFDGRMCVYIFVAENVLTVRIFNWITVAKSHLLKHLSSSYYTLF